MTQVYSHTFSFKTPDSTGGKGTLDNIISITEENLKKHFIQYIQYKTETDTNKNKILKLKQVNLKVDRSFYLEMANITLDDMSRREKLFGMLGKRRFGANDKKLNTYFIRSGLNIAAVIEAYRKYVKDENQLPVLHEKQDNNLNRFEAYTFIYGKGYFVHMTQQNISNRKTIEKIFLLELIKEDYENLLNIVGNEQKISFIFNKIGKMYFKSLKDETVEMHNNKRGANETIDALIKKNSADLEVSSSMHDNKVFQLLKEQSESLESHYFTLYNQGLELISRPEKEETIKLFSTAVVSFVNQFRKIDELHEIVSYMTALYLFAEEGKLKYLFGKYDPDFKDIFLYMLECLTDWKNSLGNPETDAYYFNVATADFKNALKYLHDTYFKFNHQYQCQDVLVAKEEVKSVIEESPKEVLTTSASSYLEEIEIDSEVYEEFMELENDIDDIQELSELDENSRTRLVLFFKGYANVLNTLFEFKDLGYSLSILSTQLQRANLEENNKILLMLMKGLTTDLLEWKYVVFVEQSAKDIHYMDKSFYSNIAQTEILLDSSKKKVESIEFF